VPALMPIAGKLLKQPGRNFHFPEKYGIPSPSFHGADHEPSVQAALGLKNSGGSWFAIGSPGQKETGRNPVHDGTKTIGHVNKQDGYSHTRHLTNQRESDAVKNGKDWFGSGENCSLQRRASSGSSARKAASALIAKIPFPLAQHIANVYKPKSEREERASGKETVGCVPAGNDT
jgi:hypothetical protein